MARVAVLGTGRMGAAMVRRLAEAQHEVSVWNRSPGPAAALAEACGVRATPTAAAAVEGSAFVLSMLADGPVTESVLLAPDLLAALNTDTVVCDLATSGVETAQRLEAELTAIGVRYVDAPVSGSVATVASGQLLIMASGSEDGVTSLTPVLGAFAKQVVFLGDAGSGQAMKLAVNLVVHTLNAAVGESLALATSAGVDPAAAYDVLEASVVAAPFVAYKRAAFLDPVTPIAMTMALSRKDLGLINEAAAVRGVDATVAAAVLAEVTRACDAGLAEQDMASIFRFLQR